MNSIPLPHKLKGAEKMKDLCYIEFVPKKGKSSRRQGLG